MTPDRVEELRQLADMAGPDGSVAVRGDELLALCNMDFWQPMADVFWDGVGVLVWVKEWNASVTAFIIGDNWYMPYGEDGRLRIPKPEKWMPLPKAPKP